MHNIHFNLKSVNWLWSLPEDIMKSFIAIMEIIRNTDFGSVVLRGELFTADTSASGIRIVKESFVFNILVLVKYDHGFDMPTNDPMVAFSKEINEKFSVVSEIRQVQYLSMDVKLKSTLKIGSREYIISWVDQDEYCSKHRDESDVVLFERIKEA
jgi:hypothetical protein